MINLVLVSFYKFTHFKDPAGLREPLLTQLSNNNLKGTILLAPEGINGTLAGPRESIHDALQFIRALPNCVQLEHTEIQIKTIPFYRLKVRLKREIVAIKVPKVDPLARVGTYVEPKDWNNLIDTQETIVIDTRNTFEVKIGTFEKAINPKTERFSDLPQWLERNHAKLENKKVAMFCTGGIRCEKATSYLKQRGIDDVYHLKGGVLQYLRDISPADSRWRGECFVFDYRVSVQHGLKIGNYELCHACRWPVSAADRLSSNFVAGVSCDHCVNKRTNEQRARYAARQEQVELATQKGELHIGVNYETFKG